MDRAGTSPNVFTVPPGVPFSRALARRLLDRHRTDDPLSFARITVFLPTRRAVRGLREEFRRDAAARGAEALLLPEILALGDVDEEELLVSLPCRAAGTELAELPPAIGAARRQVLLARLVLRWSEDRHRAGDAFAALSPGQAMVLAADLARMIDHLHTEDACLDRLADLVPEQYSGYWQNTVEFLAILSRHWPEILREEGAIDPADRRSRLLRALANAWRETPPEHPVIAAGSTGSIPATAELLAVIACLPKGEVLLPGLDTELDEQSWAQLEPSHPQYGLKHLLDILGVERDDVAVPDALHTDTDSARRRLWSTVFRPAPATADWPTLAVAAAERRALAGLYRVDAEDSAQEAGVIACILRLTLEAPGRKAALVTPDRDLARRVAAELRRWDISIDDSAGRPLAGTRAGIFLRALLDAVDRRFAPVALLSLVKNDFCRLGMEPDEKQDALSLLERHALHGLAPSPGLGSLRARLVRISEKGHAGLEAAIGLVDRLVASVAPLHRLAEAGAAPIGDFARAQIEAAEAMAGTAPGAGPWEDEDGAAALTLLEELSGQDDGPEWALGEYTVAFLRCLEARPVHFRHPGHPRLFIWGPLEARLQPTDVIVLGGLNEGTWPAPPRSDPWLNRRMQGELGLADPERRIGQSAHDFCQLACAPEVWLTRAVKVGGAPQLPSRWLLRLDAVLKAAGRDFAALAPPLPIAGIFRGLDRAAARRRIGDPRPAPPAQARPRQLSVTTIETLVRDPYAVYARHVLGLQPLAPLEAVPGPGERGSFVHDAMRRFAERFADGLPADRMEALAALMEEGAAALRRAVGPERANPAPHTFWRARFEEAAAWFIDWEYERRAAGAAPVLWEARGRLALDDTGLGFTLTARADRIDRLATGGCAVLDYKTGRAPSDKEVAAGFAPQLPLEGVILQAGGFEGVTAARAEALLYVRLNGGRKAGEECAVTGGANSAGECIAAALAGLKALIAQYHDPRTPFLSRPHVQFLGQASEYDHLARVKEWSAGGEEGGE